MKRFARLQLTFLTILAVPTALLFLLGDLLDAIQHDDVRATLWTMFALGLCVGIIYASIRVGSDRR